MKREMTVKNEDFKRLDSNNVQGHFLKAKRSVFFIEMEALPHQKFTNQSSPSPEVVE